MANRRCLLNLARHYSSSHFFPNPSFSHHSKTLIPNTHSFLPSQTLPTKQLPFIFSKFSVFSRHFCSSHGSNTSDEDDDDDDDDDDEDDYESETDERQSGPKTAEDMEREAADIGYKVVGTVDNPEQEFKPYEPVFAIVQVGSHQFKVSNGDTISTERLKYCDVNDKLILNKVLMLGSRTQTVIGRPVLPDAAVYAVVEEHALDAKVIIFKKKRRKNYRRKNGHRQELTRLRIMDIQGIAKPEKPPSGKKSTKAAPKKVEKVEKVAVAA